MYVHACSLAVAGQHVHTRECIDGVNCSVMWCNCRMTYLEPVMSTAAPSSSASSLTDANPLRSWHASITTSTRDVAVAVVALVVLPLLLYLAVGVLNVLL
jgi:hypothetical protein